MSALFKTWQTETDPHKMVMLKAVFSQLSNIDFFLTDYIINLQKLLSFFLSAIGGVFLLFFFIPFLPRKPAVLLYLWSPWKAEIPKQTFCLRIDTSSGCSQVPPVDAFSHRKEQTVPKCGCSIRECSSSKLLFSLNCFLINSHTLLTPEEVQGRVCFQRASVSSGWLWCLPVTQHTTWKKEQRRVL